MRKLPVNLSVFALVCIICLFFSAIGYRYIDGIREQSSRNSAGSPNAFWGPRACFVMPTALVTGGICRW